MTDVFLDIRDLSCGYGGIPVLDRISFSVRKGELATIIGPNGAGKTTLLKSIPGLVSPMAGEILLSGKDIHAMPPAQRALKVAVVLQAMESVYMTVEEYVLLGRLPFFKPYQYFEDKTDLDAARTYMEFTGIAHLRSSALSEISSGERQLATIARALVQEPELLLMDEPTAHLDISHQALILELVTTMAASRRVAVVMVQHDLNLASEYSDQVILLDKKSRSLYACGAPKAVITRENIRAVYDTDVAIETNPHSLKPGVFIRKNLDKGR